jgi:hypothetical protein
MGEQERHLLWRRAERPAGRNADERRPHARQADDVDVRPLP